MLSNNLNVNEKGHLTFAGMDTVELAKEYGTAIYVLDENRIRNNCRVYKENMEKAFGENSMALFASKALSFTGIYRIVKEEGMGIDVVSGGELFTALNASFPPEKIFFHGNNKTEEEIAYGIENKIGYFVADNFEELHIIDREAKKRNANQKILLRISPGIDPHTFEAVSTGKIDSKFGLPIATGQALEFAKEALALENATLCGFHCHIGSQIFESKPFVDASEIMLSFINEVKKETGFEAKVLDIGGGFGVKYEETDPDTDVPGQIEATASYIKRRCSELGLNVPYVYMEPGRSIVADAGITLYTVGNIKEIRGYKNYVSVDGGMADNPRYALYRAIHAVMLANDPLAKKDYLCTVAGRCCESDALIRENVYLPNVKKGDILAVLCTGAYNYSMASNYNRFVRPAILMIKDGKARIAVRREKYEDLIKCDME